MSTAPAKPAVVYRQSRIGSPTKARGLFSRAIQADYGASLGRKRVFDITTGVPPYDEDYLRELQRAGEVNLNMGGAEAKIDAADSQYTDLISGVEMVAKVMTRWGGGTDRIRAEQIISEELHTLLTVDNEDYTYTELRHAHERNLYGVGIRYFANRLDYRWQSAGLGEFIVQRGSESRATDFDIAFQRGRKTIPQLLAMMNPEAENIGWNLNAVKSAIFKADKTSFPSGTGGHLWEDYAKRVKANDLWFGQEDAPRVRMITAWVREYDGRLSQFIFDPDEGHYMYQAVGIYPQTTDGFILSMAGVGTGDFHTVRGLGYRLEPMENSRNRLWSKLLTSAGEATGNLWQAEEEEMAVNFQIADIGANSVIGPKFKFIQRTMPNFAQSVLPLISALDTETSNNTGSFRANPVSQGQQPTAFAVRDQIAHSTTLTSSSISLHYVDMQRVYEASMRRIQNKALRKTDPGGMQVHAFWQRIVNRDVPLEALWQVHRVIPVKAFGSGSPSLQMALGQELMKGLAYLDEAGQQEAKRIFFSSIVGWGNVNALVPKQAIHRASIDTQFAENENLWMMDGRQPPVLPGQNNFEHAVAHERAIEALLQAFADKSQEVDQMQTANSLSALIRHQEEHLQLISMDPSHKNLVEALQRGLRQAHDIFNQVSQQVEAAQRKAQMQAQAQGGPAQQGLSPEQQAIMARTQVENAATQARTQAAIQLDHMKAVAEIQRKDMKQAADMHREASVNPPGSALKNELALSRAPIQHDGAAPPV